MKTINEVVKSMEIKIDRDVIESYVAREWVKPILSKENLYFEDIDIARINLIHHLSYDIQINDAGIDVALSLLDQLYGLRMEFIKMNCTSTQKPE